MAKILEVSHDWKDSQWDWPLQHNDGIVRVINDATHFEVALDVAFFTPKEIQVQVINSQISIHAAHETRNDIHGSVSREINRTYSLPADVEPSSIKSHLSQAGVLTITAQKKK